MFNQNPHQKTSAQKFNLAAISGIVELDDQAAEECSGGYELRLFEDNNGSPGKFIAYYNVPANPNKIDLTANQSLDNVGWFSIRGGKYSQYRLTTIVNNRQYLAPLKEGWNSKSGQFFNIGKNKNRADFSEGFKIDQIYDGR